jgi:hypothetical protein
VLSKRALLGWLLALTMALVVGPAANAFACGPSAGDCQYTDPLSPTTTTTTVHQTTAPPVTTSPPLQTTMPTATTADPATATTSPTSSQSSKTLPYTGYAAWLAGALGVFLIAGGIAVRRRYITR